MARNTITRKKLGIRLECTLPPFPGNIRSQRYEGTVHRDCVEIRGIYWVHGNAPRLPKPYCNDGGIVLLNFAASQSQAVPLRSAAATFPCTLDNVYRQNGLDDFEVNLEAILLSPFSVVII